MIPRRLIWLALIVAGLAALTIYFRPERALRVATGVVAYNVCSKSFVSGLDPQTDFSETVDREGLRWLKFAMVFGADRAGETVDASLAGLFNSRAAFHDGQGCALLHGSARPYILKVDFDALKVPAAPPLLPEIAGPALVEPSDPALKAALDHAFEEPASPPFRRTKAVEIVHDSAVIAKRYANGIGVDTPLLGFSMTKPVVNALIGVPMQQGVVTPSFPAPIAGWRSNSDPRDEIEVEHLLRMTTGLALDETNSGFDPSSQKVYLHDDMAGFAVKPKLIAPIETRRVYSSATTRLPARIVRDGAGGSPEQTLRFAWRELFNPSRIVSALAALIQSRFMGVLSVLCRVI